MACSTSVLLVLVFLGDLHFAAAANCEAIVGCHLGREGDVAALKTWLSTELACACAGTSQPCNCQGKCELCGDPRVLTLTRAYWAIEEGSCDPPLAELIRVQREACVDPACCPSCPAAQFAESYRQCAVPFSNAETLFSSTYLAIAVLVFTARATVTTTVSLYEALFDDQSASGDLAGTKPPVYSNPEFTRFSSYPGDTAGLMF